MPTTTNKQRVLTHLFTSLKKRYGDSDPEPRPVLEQLLYAILREGSTRELADQAFRLLRERFFDWNEIRVSSVREIEETLSCLPNAELRAQRLISLLQEVFETTFSFDLEILHKKGVKQAAKQLSRYQAINDYAIAWVVQQSLGGHAVPLDDPSQRCLRRLGLLEGEHEELEALRGTVEHLIPKARGPAFSELISALAHDVCAQEPRCASCPLCQDCPTGQEVRQRPLTAERSSRPKSR
jgi:endonuclease III